MKPTHTEQLENGKMEKKISVEPSSFSLTGFKIEDLFSKKFIAELRKEMPTSIIGCVCIGFSDSKTIIQFQHERQDGKLDLEHVNIEGDGAGSEEKVKCAIEILKKVIV
jgi:hypothetical protein